jgi:toxin CcdB
VRQFEVHPNPSERSRPIAPFVVVLQSHLLAAAPTTVVAPMIRNDGRAAYTELSALVVFDGGQYVVSIAELAAIDSRHLSRAVGDLRAHEDAIRRALDRLFTGF